MNRPHSFTPAERLDRIVAEIGGAHAGARALDAASAGCAADRATLVDALEMEFGLEIPDAEARAIATPDDALRWLRTRGLA